MNTLKEKISEAAELEGLIYIGSTSLHQADGFKKYLKWLDEGRHGQMAFMEKNLVCRKDPSKALEGALSALVFGMKYYIPEGLPRGNKPVIAQYARYKDYHKVFRKKLKKVTSILRQEFKGSSFREISDSVPVLERELALGTASGFTGKNTLFIHYEHGSMILLGEILTTENYSEQLNIDYDLAPSKKSCGECRRCQVHCPTGALDQDYRIDSRKCLSYWTIEHRGPIPEKYWRHLSKYIFGCDICQLVCPFNREQTKAATPVSYPKSFDLFELATMSQNTYENLIGGSPMVRAKRGGLMRNALIAMYVTEDTRISEAISVLDKDESICLTSLKPTLLQVKKKLRDQSL